MTFKEIREKKDDLREYASNVAVKEHSYQRDNESDFKAVERRQLSEEELQKIVNLTWSA